MTIEETQETAIKAAAAAAEAMEAVPCMLPSPETNNTTALTKYDGGSKTTMTRFRRVLFIAVLM